jgi:L-seryl-tRNA(Ser) seleniumtransferase
MLSSFFPRKARQRRGALNRRDLLKQGGMFTVASALPVGAAAATTAPSTGAAHAESVAMYRAIGVDPVINAKGTFTIITGSQTLPEKTG